MVGWLQCKCGVRIYASLDKAGFKCYGCKVGVLLGEVKKEG